MKRIEIDINYTMVDNAIKALQEYAGQGAYISIRLEPVRYEDQGRIVVTIELPGVSDEDK